MSRRPRRNHSPAFKSKVSLAGLKEAGIRFPKNTSSSYKLCRTNILLCSLGTFHDTITFYYHSFLSISGGTVILASLLVRV